MVFALRVEQKLRASKRITVKLVHPSRRSGHEDEDVVGVRFQACGYRIPRRLGNVNPRW